MTVLEAFTVFFVLAAVGPLEWIFLSGEYMSAGTIRRILWSSGFSSAAAGFCTLALALGGSP